jgi:hypothetical protein
MNKDEALRLALEALEKISMGGDPRRADPAITAIKAALEAKDEPDHSDELTIAYMSGLHRGKEVAQRTWVGLTPSCPRGLTEYACEVEGVELVCHLEYTPSEDVGRDSYGLPSEPGTAEDMDLVNAYIKGTDIDIGHLLLQGIVDHITTTALEDMKNDVI